MSNGRESSPGQDILLFGGLTVLVIFGGWFIARVPVMWVSFYASYYLMKAYIHLPFLMTKSEYQSLVSAYHAIPTIDPTKFGIGSLMQLWEYHGYVWRWVMIPLLLFLGWKTKKSTVRFKYRREIKSVYDLIEIQAPHFPASAIVRGKNLLEKHQKIGPWATYDMPLDFALDHQMLFASKKPVSADDKVDEKTMLPIRPFTPDEKLEPFSIKRGKMHIPHYNNVLFNHAKATKAFTAQLGPLWEGPEKLPPLLKALYAIFITQGAGKRAEAWEMICQIAFSWVEGEVDKKGKLISPHRANTAGVDELIKKYGKHPKITEITNRHAHTYNVLVELLHWARQKGRLYNANLGWVRPVNRTLFFAILDEGAQCPFWESAGLWAHAQIERRQNRKITMPMVAGAVIAMKDTLSKEHWIDPGEYSEEHQKKLVMEANNLLDAEQEKARQQKTKPGPPPRPAQRQTRPNVNAQTQADGEP